MEYRDLGGTGMRVSEISLGTWALGGEWGTGAAAGMTPLSDGTMQREVHHLW